MEITEQTRKAVLKIIDEPSYEKKHILCDLEGIDYDFFENYAPVAVVEQGIIDGVLKITSFNLVSEAKGPPAIAIYYYDEVEVYNESFGWIDRHDESEYGSCLIKPEFVSKMLLDKMKDEFEVNSYIKRVNPVLDLYKLYGFRRPKH